MIDKDSFRQAGQDLLRKVREAEQIESGTALSSWREIEARLEAPRKVSGLRLRYLVASVAAAVGLLLAMGSYFWITERLVTSLPLALLEEERALTLPGDEIVLIENGRWVQLENGASIRYDSAGRSDVERHAAEEKSLGTMVDKPNQIIVPQGRWASVVLSDGTKININAHTRVIYPVKFAGDKREILVEGEVFLDVTPDSSRPFIVKTNGFDVKVLGTQFNVCAYKDDAMASVVLVEGSVEVKTSKKDKAILTPNQLIEIKDKGTNIMKVDVFEYICWKDNLMLLDNYKVGEIFDKLTRYYGRKIQYSEEVGKIPMSGKLTLCRQLEDVIGIICQSLYLQQQTDKNNTIIISK